MENKGTEEGEAETEPPIGEETTPVENRRERSDESPKATEVSAEERASREAQAELSSYVGEAVASPEPEIASLPTPMEGEERGSGEQAEGEEEPPVWMEPHLTASLREEMARLPPLTEREDALFDPSTLAQPEGGRSRRSRRRGRNRQLYVDDYVSSIPTPTRERSESPPGPATLPRERRQREEELLSRALAAEAEAQAAEERRERALAREAEARSSR